MEVPDEGDRGDGRGAGTVGMKLVERPSRRGRRRSLSARSDGDVVVQVHASGFTWMSCRGPRTGSIGSAVTGRRRSRSRAAGVVTPLAMERRGCRWASGVRLTDGRDGTLAEYVAVEGCNLRRRRATLTCRRARPADAGLTAW